MKQKRSIMIVDDEVDTSQMMKAILERTGLYEVAVCNSGAEALERIREWRPELVLLDIVMPDADGTDIAAQIRRERMLALTQVVFITSLVSDKELAKDATIGGYPFISKPVTGDALLERVKGFF